ncbi:MAG: type II and III secretion system protein, partial [Candidatus Omnitrophota bacterium]
ITGWEEQNIGINLEVTPQISPDGHVKLQLKPEVSNIVDYVGDSLNQRPVTSTRKAETEVQIKDGQTVVIGGLVKTKEARKSKKIPFLGDIPFLGKIFTRNEQGTDAEPEEKTDLLIFVTAHIIKDGDGSAIAAENNSIARARPFKLQPRGKNAQ